MYDLTINEKCRTARILAEQLVAEVDSGKGANTKVAKKLQTKMRLLAECRTFSQEERELIADTQQLVGELLDSREALQQFV